MKTICLSFIVSLCSFANINASPIGVVESWQLVSGIQDTYGGLSQVYTNTDTVQSPLQTYQQINHNQSWSGAYLNSTIDDQNLVLIVQPEQHCERTNTSSPSCLWLGEIFLNPSVDLVFDFQGFYTYHLSGTPTAISSYMKVTQLTASGNVGPTVVSQFYAYDSITGPLDGTLLFSQTATLLAGTRYWIKFNFLSHASYDGLIPGSFVDMHGIVSITTHPVPEPTLIGVLPLVLLLFCPKSQRFDS